MIRREVCACGGVIVTAIVASPEQIARHVRNHNRTRRHLDWRLAMDAIYGAPLPRLGVAA